jgi:hypothetical protein
MDESPMLDNPFDKEEKSGSQPIVWAILGITAMCCGVLFVGALFYFRPNAESLYAQYFPSPTPTPSRTPTSTPTFTPTATNTPTPTPNLTGTAQVQNALATATNAANKWRVVLKDTFDSNKNKWLVKPSDDEYALTTYSIADGKYTWDTTAHKPFINWIKTGTKPLTDFYVSMEIKQTDGPDTADYGIVFREDGNSNFYYFAINEQGQYALYLYNDEWSTLVNLTQSDLINPGEANRLTVIGEGSHFTFFINDQYLTETTDDTLSKGITALAVELADVNDHAVFEFDNLELRAP